MPTYHYVCNACRSELEMLQSMTEKPKKKCPNCKRPKLLRLIGAGGGVVFRGSFPGQDIRRQKEDNTIYTKAKIARRMKASKKVPMDATIHARDVDISKYHGPKNLPKGHPERG